MQPDAAQLKLAADFGRSEGCWKDQGFSEQLSSGQFFMEQILCNNIQVHQVSIENYAPFNVRSHWPLYSLRPSVNRAEFYDQLPLFSEDPADWPVYFEYDFGVAFVSPYLFLVSWLF